MLTATSEPARPRLFRGVDRLLKTRRFRRPADIVYTHFGFLLWAAVATTALCLVLARRRARVTACRTCVANWFPKRCRPTNGTTGKSPSTCTTARCRLCSPPVWTSTRCANESANPALEMVHAALQETAAALRSTVTELHPQVLAQLGLTPAIRELLRQFESRGEYVVEAELEEVGKPESQQLAVPGGARTAGECSQTRPCDDRARGAVADEAIGSSSGLPTTERVSTRPTSNAMSPTGTSGWARCWRGSTRWAVRWRSNPRGLRHAGDGDVTVRSANSSR